VRLVFNDEGAKGECVVASEESPATPAASSRPPNAPDAVVVVIGGPIAPADVPGLCDHVRSLLDGTDAAVVVCDVSAVATPDVGTVDALARLALAARRLGRQIHLRDAPRELTELLALVGLAGVVGCDYESG
jgi:ABC-type transporter Mla MlaB component